MTRSNTQLAAHWGQTPLARLITPMQQFVRSETSSGIVLIATTVIALVIANSPLVGAYERVLESYIGITIGSWELKETVLHWINDGLMALFFFLVGLELKREAIVGELSSLRQAALPFLAACGGAIIPAIIYTLVNRGGPGAPGWGVPMATDIAFALGVLALLGNRVPWPLKVFLTAIAVIDDLLAVVVIALFYSSGINFVALGIGVVVLGLLAFANMFGIRTVAVYVALGLIVWLAFLESGVHATIAGVLVALTVPARNRIDAPQFLNRARGILREFEQGPTGATPMLTDERQQSAVLELEDACEAVQAPLQKLEHRLQPWVAFVIVPVFALANAGVVISPSSLSGAALPISFGVALGLIIGKPIGLIGASWLAVRAGVAALPEGVTWRQVIGVGCLGGLGFTMSLFIATLGLGESELLEAAKIGILGASLVAGLTGYLVLSRVLPAAARRE